MSEHQVDPARGHFGILLETGVISARGIGIGEPEHDATPAAAVETEDAE